MNDENPAAASGFSTEVATPQERPGVAGSAQMLAQHAREQASQAGDYLSHNLHQYPFAALVIAGLIGYGIGFLVHTRWGSETQPKASAGKGHSGDVLRPPE